jgi:transcriptional regulator with XRE-family HTH domain
MSRPLKNYIRTFRRSSFLSQDEIAYLLGYRQDGGFHVSRFERGKRSPILQVALGLALILGVDPMELFAGEVAEIEETIHCRARILRAHVTREPEGARRDQRIETLQRLMTDEYETY